MMKKIIWISSYPKSGNTYVRCFLSHYLYNSSSDFSFESLDKIPKFESKQIFNKVMDPSIYSGKLNYYKYFLEIQKRLIKNYNQKELIFKTHHFFGEINNFQFTAKETTLFFIYIVRDPREVLVSYSNYKNKKIDEEFKTFLSDTLLQNSGMETIINWGAHYRSWKSFKSVPSIFIKYEDLVTNPIKHYMKLLNFLSDFIDIKIDKKLFDKTIKFTMFDNLKMLENKNGFKEGEIIQVKNFFNTGKTNSWKGILNKYHTDAIEKKFNKEMNELNYI